ncbi:Hypothetical protein P9303_24101 [Prochlorococcus marinus str. MIT 9303]|uniref:Uncharacterized protein n=2 Tax=Prochlorococcus marinus TaxID=1219 RepID=A2CCD3_PROM3|nr:Hypothetical protein P9303_24101 [Prochlorococcus marinus str. MIT 9303]
MNQEEIMQQLQVAVQAYQSKDLDGAEAVFKQILAVNPKEPNALHLLGCIYKDRGQHQQAVELIQASIREDESNPIPFFNLGKILAIAGQHENAVGVFQEALKRNQQIPETWFCFANALREIGKTEEAKQAYRNALQLNPAHAGAAGNLGALLTDDGELDEAEQLFVKAVDQYPNNVNLRINYGRLLAEKAEHAAAIMQYQIALPLAPQSPELHYNFANALKEEGDVEEAIASYRKAIEVKPDFADAYFALGLVMKEEGDVEEAIASYRKAIEVKPDFADAYFALGLVMKEEGDVEEAIASYRKAIEVKPDFADAYFALGLVMKEEGDVEEAIASYRKAIEVKPDFADAYFALGLVMKEEGDVEEAIASYRKAIEVKPDFADAYLNLGNVLKEEGEIDEARQIITTLRQMKSFEKETWTRIQDKTLVFDWHHRRALGLLWQVELAAFSGMEPASCLPAVKQADALCFPPSFLGDEISCEDGKLLYEKGYLVEEGLVSPGLCAQLISQFNNGKAPMSAALIESVEVNGILRFALERIFLHTGFPHLIWNCIYFAKGPDDETVSDTWHYDNHYNAWTPKLMIYLNSQGEECGATEFVDAGLSRKISEKSDYMGLVWQRKSYPDMVKDLVEDLNLDPVSLDPEHYTFSPDHVGSGVWFCPARALHRGVSPKKGLRHVLSFSLTPLPKDCGWSVDQCEEKSIEILKDKIEKGMQKTDVNPYWMLSEVRSA